VLAHRQQPLLDQVGDGRLAGAGQAGEPQAARRLVLDPRARRLVHVQVLPVDVAGAPQREVQRSGGDGGVALAVDQDEGAERTVARVRLERERLVEVQVAAGDLVELQVLGGQVLLGVDVDLVLDLGDRGADRARAQLQQVGPARQQALVAHPQQVRGELVGDLRRIDRGGDHVAAAGIDLVGQGQGDRLAVAGVRKVAAGSDDPRHRRAPCRRQHHHFVADRDPATGNGAGEAAEILVGTIDPLHRQAESGGLGGRLHLHGFQVLQQAGTAIPRHRRGPVDHVVAAQRRQRDRLHVGDAELRGEVAVAGDDGIEHVLPVIHQVHLVHRQQNVADAEQRGDVAVPAGLGQQALARIHQHHRQVRGGCAGGHVAGVLLVAGAVGDDELAPFGAEEAIRDVDGDALLPLRGQAIDQQREIELAALGAVPAAVRFQRGDLVVQQQFGVVQQAPDQGALAVVHAAAGDEPQQALGFVLLQVGGDVRGHQKYPSCFFFSIDAAGSWSITRPCRSDDVATSISAMTFSSVSAPDSIAPVSG